MTTQELGFTPNPEEIINAYAATRHGDEGGWGDIEKAGHGKVLNIAIEPGVNVQIRKYPLTRLESIAPIIVNASSFGDEKLELSPDGNEYDGKHDLIKAAINVMQIPGNIRLEVHIDSDMPPGASTGTSASVSVALMAALDKLTPDTTLSVNEIAMAAHKLETEELDLECGIQDQIAAAYGGINYIEVFKWPNASVSPVNLPNEIIQQLDDRLLLFVLGKAHSSSEVHKMVLERLGEEGPNSPAFVALREMAVISKDALCRGDLKSFGRIMAQNTECQRELHPDLISAEHQRIMDIAENFGAWGWKVNGAGGPGGSVTVMAPPIAEQTKKMIKVILENTGAKLIPTSIYQKSLQVYTVRNNH